LPIVDEATECAVDTPEGRRRTKALALKMRAAIEKAE
jgi:hypothetical protein